jgi:TPR repeat protein
VGITSMSQTNAQNINWAIPAKSVTELIADGTVSVTDAEIQGQKELKGNLRAQALAIRCEKNVSSACLALGFSYDTTKDGLATDHATAARLYQKACDLGHATGCANLGNSYLHGNGVRRDLHRGLELAGAGCERGVREGCWDVGDAFEHNDGVRDLARALEYHQKGCEQGYEPSCAAAKRLRAQGNDHEVTARR